MTDPLLDPIEAALAYWESDTFRQLQALQGKPLHGQALAARVRELEGRRCETCGHHVRVERVGWCKNVGLLFRCATLGHTCGAWAPRAEATT